jgi:hypothetical protein
MWGTVFGGGVELQAGPVGVGCRLLVGNSSQYERRQKT